MINESNITTFFNFEHGYNKYNPANRKLNFRKMFTTDYEEKTAGQDTGVAGLNIIWMKAAVLGCLWASAEIIAGSFLHNIRFPFTGVFLTCTGMILLISVSCHWRDNGLIWRAGLICALMKSVSPSAVILGPMTGIFMEALLLDLAVTVLGRNHFGYILGSVMAVSWVFIQRAASFIIVYGFDIVGLYQSIVFFAEKQLSFHFDNVWMPLIFIWLIYIITGVLAALAGIRIGRKVDMSRSVPLSLDQKEVMRMKSGEAETSYRYSLTGLWITLAGMILTLMLMNFSAPVYYLPIGFSLLIFWIIRYNTVLTKLKKPKFWWSFAIITLLSALLFSKVPSSGMTTMDGLLAGLDMNFRAALMIIGFTVAGKELSNPVIRKFLQRRNSGQTSLALEAAFETLPFVISNMPKAKDFLRQPALSLGFLAAQADFWLTRLRVTLVRKSNVVMITGPTGAGKTTMMLALAQKFREAGFYIQGFVSPSVYRNNIHQGYDLTDVWSQKRVPLSTTEPAGGLIQVGRFYFLPDGYHKGIEILSKASGVNADILMVEEIGAWELRGQGWASALNRLILENDTPIILAVSDKLTSKITEAWRFSNPLIIPVKENTTEEAFVKTLDFIRIK